MLTGHIPAADSPGEKAASKSAPAMPRYKKLKVKLSPHSYLTQKHIEELDQLLDFTSPRVLNRQLRDVFIFALILDDGLNIAHQTKLVENFHVLFNLFDNLEDAYDAARVEGQQGR